MFSKIRKAGLFIILALLCIYFTITFSSSLNDKSEKELTQSTLRINEVFDLVSQFVSNTSDMGDYYFELENPRIDKNFNKIEYYDNFYYTTEDRLMDLNRRIYGRGSISTVSRDDEYINVVFFLDRFFRDFSASFEDVSIISYYSKHRFIYSYTELGSDYMSKIGYYSEKYRAESIINKIKREDDIIWETVVNANYVNEKELSVSAPVYDGGKLEGLISINFSVDTINQILLNNFYQTFLIDKNGYIIGTNTNKAVGEENFENIKDYNYFGTEKGQVIVTAAFDQSQRGELRSQIYKFSEPIVDEYVIFTYVPAYSYFFKVITSLVSVFIVGKIIFWLNETYEKRRNVRVELKQKYEEVSKFKLELEEVATTDFLTKLYNRRYLLVRMDEERSFHKSEKNAKFIILMMDIDHFKKVNDTYGHQAGDEVLKSVSNTIKESVRKEDLVSRWGGEEIMAILVNSDLETGRVVAERIREKVSETIVNVDGQEIKVTISIGVRSLYMVGNFDNALTQADDALYHAKSTGRNKVVLYSELDLEDEFAKRSFEW